MKKLSLLTAFMAMTAAAVAAVPAPVIDLKCNAGDLTALQDISANKCQVKVQHPDKFFWADGPAGRTLVFKDNASPRGNRGTVVITPPATFDTAKGFTLIVNFKTPKDYNYKRRYQLVHFAQGADKLTGFSLFIYWRSVMFRYGKDSRTGIASKAASHPMRPDTWYEAAVTFDGKKTVLYLNGEAVATGDNAVVPMPPRRRTPIAIGSTSAGGAGYGFDGMISKFQLYDRALTADEIADME